ncbi:hypothetical protein, partial [Rhodopseudomonas parapalustris]
MNKINFVDYVTQINAANLNQMQTNAETAINGVQGNVDVLTAVIGALASLNSTDKTSIVNAINSVITKAADDRRGQYFPWWYDTPPTGALILNGQAVSRTTYALLDAKMYCGDAKNATSPYWYRTTSASSPSANRSTTGQYLVLPDIVTENRYIRATGGSLVAGTIQQNAIKAFDITVNGGAYVTDSGSSQLKGVGGTHPDWTGTLHYNGDTETRTNA